jgi:hypothetical protein
LRRRSYLLHRSRSVAASLSVMPTDYAVSGGPSSVEHAVIHGLVGWSFVREGRFRARAYVSCLGWGPALEADGAELAEDSRTDRRRRVDASVGRPDNQRRRVEPT